MKKLTSLLFALLIPVVIGVQTSRHRVEYTEDLHGAPVKFGTYVFDVDSENKAKWKSYEYFISCEHFETKPQFPFMKYDGERDLLKKFNIHTGKMQSATLGKDIKNPYPLFLLQPNCERGIEPVL